MKFLVMLFLALFVSGPVLATEDAEYDDEYYEEENLDEEQTDEEDLESEISGAAVVERVSCADMQNKITELTNDEDSAEDLAYWKQEYRTKCTRGAGARLTSADARMSVEYDDTEYVEEDIVEEAQEEVVEEVTELTTKISPRKKSVGTMMPKMAAAQKVEAAQETQVTDVKEKEAVAEEGLETTLTPEQELANLDAGLCADGSAPNRFGCCTGEIFKDLGNTVFACCPKDGGEESDCFPPIQN